MKRSTTKSMNSILWKYWRAYFNRSYYLPATEKVIWTDLRYDGDNRRTGTPCDNPNQQLSRFLTPMHCFGKLIEDKVYREEREGSPEPGQPLVLKVDIKNRRPKNDPKRHKLSRLDVLKQMFDALINR